MVPSPFSCLLSVFNRKSFHDRFEIVVVFINNIRNVIKEHFGKNNCATDG